MYDNANLQKLTLTLAAITCIVCVYVARSNPATSYELSIYNSTPIIFWILFGIGLAICIVNLLSVSGKHHRLSVIVCSLLVFIVICLPVIRGYYFHGETDSMIHMGYAIDIQNGNKQPFDIFYPGIHILAITINDITRNVLRWSIMTLVYIFALVYVIFTILSVRSLHHHRYAITFSTLGALSLLPINHLSTSLYVHASTQAILFSPLILFVIIRWGGIGNRSIIIFIVSILGILVFHPQQFANIIVLLFGTLITITLLGGRTNIYSLKKNNFTKVIFVSLITSSAIFWMWFENREQLHAWFTGFITNLLTETTSAESTRGRGVSLEQVGGSLIDGFLRIFTGSLIFSVFTLILLIIILWKGKKSNDGITYYLLTGSFGVFMMFVAWVVTGQSDQYFRYFGFLMVLVTIFGSVGAYVLFVHVINYYQNEPYVGEYLKTLLLLLIIISFVTTLPIIHSSPYMYYHSDHVPQSQMYGYETAIQHSSEEIEFTGVRTSARRYSAAIYGTNAGVNYKGTTPDHFANQNITGYYNTTVYLATTEGDRIRDPVLWKGFRYSHDDFIYLDNTHDINKVHSNGGFELYYI